MPASAITGAGRACMVESLGFVLEREEATGGIDRGELDLVANTELRTGRQNP